MDAKLSFLYLVSTCLQHFKVSREINHIVPVIYSFVQSHTTISWPSHFTTGFEDCVGAIDCSSHFRNRVHPGQANYYRADKGAFFLTAQLVTSLTGSMYSLCIGLGHNNDKGMLIISGLKEYIIQNGIRLFAEQGYSLKEYLITPDDSKSIE